MPDINITLPTPAEVGLPTPNFAASLPSLADIINPPVPAVGGGQAAPAASPNRLLIAGGVAALALVLLMIPGGRRR